MYVRGNTLRTIAGSSRALPVGIELLSDAPRHAEASVSFRTPFRCLVVGFRVSANAQTNTFRVRLDDEDLQLERTSGTDGEGYARFLGEIELPRAEPECERLLTVTSLLPVCEVHDIVVRLQGLGDDPIADELAIEEGRYWSRWVQAHCDVGDQTIADGERPGTHPSFLTIGIVEPDRRDLRKRFGNYTDRSVEFMLEGIDPHRDGMGLDLGCGCGQFALYAARKGVRMVGVDLGAGLLKIGRRTASERAPSQGLEYIRADSGILPFRDGTFDLILSKDSLHHLPDVERGFGEMRRTMKPDATFVGIEPIYSSPFLDRLYVWTTDRLRPLIRRRYTKREVPAVLSYGSPLEDSGSNAVLPAFRKAFKQRRTIVQHPFVDYVDMHVHYAFHRWRWLLGGPILAVAWCVEWAIRIRAGRPLGVILQGREKR